MDWNRVKNILIALFLIVNVFLTYQLITISRNQYKYTDEEELQGIIKHLNNKNIQVKAEIPDRVLIPPSIRVRYQLFDAGRLAETLMYYKKYEKNGTDQNFELKSGNIRIQVKDGIDLIYNDADINTDKSTIDEDKCMNNAYSFTSKLKLNTSHRYVKLKQVEKGYIRLVLGQQYNNIPVESSLVEIIVTDQGVAQAKVKWFEWIKPDKKYNITTPVIALLAAYGDRKASDEAIEIRQIRQGYYFKTEINENSKEIIPEGTVEPMWVISSNKNEIYINAYNENIEKVFSNNLP